MRILILGSSGFLGSTIFNTLKNKFNINHNGLRKRKKDLSKKEELLSLLESSQPDIVINCSAITNVDYCEKKKKETKLINSDLLKRLVNYNKNLKKPFWLIHFSTDSLYFKNKSNSEKEKIKILNYYARSKYEAENHCKQKALVFRTNFFGRSTHKEKSFSDFIYKAFRSKKKFFLVNDVFFNPLRVVTIAKILKYIILKKKKYYGVYNLGSNGFMSKYSFAEFFAKKAKIFNKNCFEVVDSKKIFKIKRSNYMTMSVKKFEKNFSYKLPYIKKEIINEIRKNYEKN